MATTFQNTLGGDYLRLRAEVNQALEALSALAGESLATFAHVARLQAFSHALQAPLRLVAIGEKRAGKSTLLLALSGQSSPDERRGEFALTEVNSSAEESEFVVPDGDLLFGVFSIAQPWTPPLWQRLQRLPAGSLEKMAIILQQSDLRDEREVKTVCDHLRQTAARQLGGALPVFPVAAKAALLARTSGLDKARLWTESHFDPLEAYLNARLQAPDGPMGELRRTCVAAQSVLAELVAHAQGDKRVVSTDRLQLAHMREATDRFKQQAEAQEPAFRQDIDEAAARGQEQGEHLLNQRLRGRGALRLAFRQNDHWLKELHRNVTSIMRAAAVRQIEAALRILEDELNAAWEQFDAAQETLGAESQRRLVLDAAVFEGSCAHLVEEIELTVAERMADNHAETLLREQVAKIARALRRAWAFGIFGAVGVAVGLVLGQPLVALAMGLAAGSAWLFGWRTAARGRGEALAMYREQMRAKREELARAASQPIREAISVFHLTLNDLLQPLDESCRVQEARGQPILTRVRELDETFRNLAARLEK